jgi:hypothetical protein
VQCKIIKRTHIIWLRKVVLSLSIDIKFTFLYMVRFEFLLHVDTYMALFYVLHRTTWHYLSMTFAICWLGNCASTEVILRSYNAISFLIFFSTDTGMRPDIDAITSWKKTLKRLN